MSPFLRLLSGRSARVAQLGLLALGAADSPKDCKWLRSLRPPQAP